MPLERVLIVSGDNALSGRISGLLMTDGYSDIHTADCGAQARKLIENGTTHLILGHLSQDNNQPYIADKTVAACLSDMERGKDYLMGVAPVETQGGAVIF